MNCWKLRATGACKIVVGEEKSLLHEGMDGARRGDLETARPENRWERTAVKVQGERRTGSHKSHQVEKVKAAGKLEEPSNKEAVDRLLNFGVDVLILRTRKVKLCCLPQKADTARRGWNGIWKKCN